MRIQSNIQGDLIESYR